MGIIGSRAPKLLQCRTDCPIGQIVRGQIVRFDPPVSDTRAAPEQSRAPTVWEPILKKFWGIPQKILKGLDTFV